LAKEASQTCDYGSQGTRPIARLAQVLRCAQPPHNAQRACVLGAPARLLGMTIQTDPKTLAQDDNQTALRFTPRCYFIIPASRQAQSPVPPRCLETYAHSEAVASGFLPPFFLLQFDGFVVRFIHLKDMYFSYVQ
jgi:hypothetical protein